MPPPKKRWRKKLTIAAVQENVEAVQHNLDHVWILLAGFLVFFMQAGFAMLEGGMIRETGVVNSLAENFMDACVTGIVFFIVGYGIAFGAYDAEALASAASILARCPADCWAALMAREKATVRSFVNFFFQFAFAGAAATIATGAMAERTEFIGQADIQRDPGRDHLSRLSSSGLGAAGWIAEAGFR